MLAACSTYISSHLYCNSGLLLQPTFCCSSVLVPQPFFQSALHRSMVNVMSRQIMNVLSSSWCFHNVLMIQGQIFDLWLNNTWQNSILPVLLSHDRDNNIVHEMGLWLRIPVHDLQNPPREAIPLKKVSCCRTFFTYHPRWFAQSWVPLPEDSIHHHSPGCPLPLPYPKF